MPQKKIKKMEEVLPRNEHFEQSETFRKSAFGRTNLFLKTSSAIFREIRAPAAAAVDGVAVVGTGRAAGAGRAPIGAELLAEGSFHARGIAEHHGAAAEDAVPHGAGVAPVVPRRAACAHPPGVRSWGQHSGRPMLVNNEEMGER